MGVGWRGAWISFLVTVGSNSLNPATYETEVVLDDFPRTVHELLVVPETLSAAFCNLDRDAQEDLTRRYEDLCAHYP